ncbi:hypothetical protein Tco_1570787, partial [Tanacetum coccineum]
ASGTIGASDFAQAPPPPPPSSSTHQGDQSTSTAAPSSSKTVASTEYSAWTTTDTRVKPSSTTITNGLYMDDATTADEQAVSSDDEVGRDHIPTVNLRQSWWKPLTEDRPATPEPAWTIPSSDLTMPTNNWCLISFGLKRSASMTSQLCMVSLTGGFKDNDSTLIDSHLKETAEQKGLLYLLNLQGHLNHLSPKDKKILTTAVNLWTRNLVIRKRVEDFQLGIESYQTLLNLTKPRWEATGFEFKHDFTVIDSPRAVIFRDIYRVQMIMRFNEIHKFSDGTLQQIDEALDYRVKEFRINRTNPGMNPRFWTKKDVDRSKDFMFAIQKRLKTRRVRIYVFLT